MSEELFKRGNGSAAIITERSETENARLAAEPDEKMPWETYSQELGIEARRDEPALDLPHVEGSNESKENLQELREANCAAVREFRLFDQAEVGEARQDERVGRILHANHFLELLRKTGLVAVYTKCQAAKVLKHDSLNPARLRERIAQYERTMAGLTVMGNVRVTLPRPVYATWVQIPWMIEYSVMRFDAHGLATTQKFKGWRTVLLELIRQGHVTEAECNRVFGEARGEAAKRWGSILQAMRSA